MIVNAEGLRFSSKDLTGYVACDHLTSLELDVAKGIISRPKLWDPALESLWERGFRHEQDFIQHLKAEGLNVVTIDGIDIDEAAVQATTGAMATGIDVIVQAALRSGNWIGRADVLRRVERSSVLGPWSYEAYDTKLSRETKSATVLQLCLYSEMLGEMQGAAPEYMHVVAPWTNFVPESFRVAEYSAYYRRIRSGLESSIATAGETSTYPHPTAHCDICAWRGDCAQRRRADDHLSLVAGITSLQIVELKANSIETVEALAVMPLPMPWIPARGSQQSFERVREQARIQVESRNAGTLLFESLPLVTGYGLSALPEPTPADIYLDFEGDSFVGEHGQEYLLGYWVQSDDVIGEYVPLWGLSRQDEKGAFETFIDFVMARWAEHPSLHIYHYGAYEVGALKRLMGRFATREDELDRILRGRLMVDLLSIVRHAVRAGVESYSIKKLEPIYDFTRRTDLPDANIALTRLQTGLELGDIADISVGDRDTVASYNRDDCLSTSCLHSWLEHLRARAIKGGAEIDRPEPGDGAPSEKVAEWLARITPLVEALTAGVPADVEERSPEQHAAWLLAQMLDFHRREDKATWWEYYRLSDLDAEELLEEKSGLSSLTLQASVGGTTKCPIHRYAFPPQETDLRPGKKLKAEGGASLGSVEAISVEGRTIDIKKTGAFADIHPAAVFMHEFVGSEPMMESLIRIAEFVVANGVNGAGAYLPGRDLLLRQFPRCGDGHPVQHDGEEPLDAAVRISATIEDGVLPVQGPPGAGKTYTGSRMIVELVRRGKRVGIVANGHAVVRNLIDAVIERADEMGVDLVCVQKPGDKELDGHRLKIVSKNADVITALQGQCKVAGGTAWLWSSPEMHESVDVLFVDEAAQMSLANVLAVSQAAQAVVLLGDPRQLDQPTKGSHPEGTDTSALDHLLEGAQTIEPEQGLFLAETWRLHPEICAFTSELFYDAKLHSRPGLELQAVTRGPVMGSGLRFIPVEHVGNHNCSPEEADVVAEMVSGILASGATWITADGEELPIGLTEILIITPYNAQVYEIQQRLPGARIGTVDKFQGQEAPIAIYSLATSSHADAPRGMEFLYSLNRLNVATSRARCLSLLVCSPAVFEAECRNPRQMQLANAFCRYLELAV
jgi:predicted RecB family nuclease